ncbi:hypothetical protein QR680_006050 [Steinernema hermaphroditum]|uniref:Nuclear receptor domain-containing protein n=1 Tax=Steinernema hermaphroditum TaxID=289476 RepID=A0AA39LWQ5_9BILA|nr:hypothetical protein QR680_006050 [Steinernema hermaphroditum]
MSLAEQNGTSNCFCKVCGAKANGIHFRVASCRACAAFFRRSSAESRRYTCRQGNGNCNLKTINCRSCRFARCRRAGMTLDGLPYRGIRYDAGCPDIDRSSGEMANEDSIVEEDLPEVTVEGHQFKYDTEAQMSSIVQILEKPFSSHIRAKETPLQSAVRALGAMLEESRRKTIKMSEKIDFRVIVWYAKVYMERIARFSMECEEYVHLPLEDKRKMYCNSWNAIYLLERCARTIDLFGTNCPPELYLYTDCTAVDLLHFEYFLPNVDEQQLQKMNAHFHPLNESMMRNFVAPMKAMNPTLFEVAFLCLFKIWSVRKVQGLSSRTHEIADAVIEGACDELHEYYISELRLKNYVTRISKLFHIISGIESLLAMRTDKLITADLCKIYKNEFDDSDFSAFKDFSKDV